MLRAASGERIETWAARGAREGDGTMEQPPPLQVVGREQMRARDHAQQDPAEGSGSRRPGDRTARGDVVQPGENGRGSVVGGAE